jgi:hypothetical protein
MDVCFLGTSHLRQVHERVLRARGFRSVAFGSPAEILFIAEDVYDHGDLKALDKIMGMIRNVGKDVTVVVISQVPPGYMRPWVEKFDGDMYYQIDTIIMREAVARVARPEQIVVARPRRSRYRSRTKATC